MNVLLYVMDALRADHLSCYGYERKTTPNIDTLADEGVRYTDCYSTATWTKPASASLLTGLYPPAHGVRTREDTFDRAVPRLPEVLSGAGLTTGGFSTMGNVSASLGYGTGFDTYRDLYKEPEIVRRRQTTDADGEELDHESVAEVAIPRASDINDRLGDWLDDMDDEFFAFCWSVEPHIPYDPPEGFRDYADESYDGPVDGQRETLPTVDTERDLAQLEALYDGEIRYNDQQLGLLLDGLRERGLYDDTLVLVAGDHGDAFHDHGQLTHGNLPYDEVLHVPLVVKPPAGTTTELDTVDEMCSLVDVAPTIAAAAGESWHDELDGRPLPPWGPSGSSAPVFSETRSRDIYPAYYSIRTEDWKYMSVDEPNRNVGTLGATVKQLFQQGMIREILRHPVYYFRRYSTSEDRFLFDLTADPEERTNLVGDRPELADELHDSIEQWVDAGERLGARFGHGDETDIDDATNEQLRRLGYID